MKKILVTGGAGFLGSNLCKKLLEQGNYVIALDNLYTGKLKNIENLLENKNFKFINHDIIEPIDITVDEIYNFACPASPVNYQKDPEFTFKTCVFGIYNMLKIANKTNAKILQASTSEIYGNPLIHPQKEDYFGNVNTVGIRSCYDEGKRAVETIMSDFNRKYGTKIKIARIFNTYGPNMDKADGRVISNFINQALENKDITVYGNGNQTRSFCYVDDLIEGIIKLMESSDDVTYPVNIGNPDERTVLETAEMIIKMTGSISRIVFKEIPKDDPVKRCPDITKANEILKWYPKTSLKEGLEKTIEYYKNNR